jgi:potassium channel subfamily K
VVNDLGSTVIDSFKKGTFRFADFTILPKQGVWKDWLQSNPRLWKWLVRRKEQKDRKKRLKEGLQFPSGDDEMNNMDQVTADDSEALHPNMTTLSQELTDDKQHQVPPDAVLARRLALAIRQVATDLKSVAADTKHYTFEEWAELTRLIRFTSQGENEAIAEENEEGIIEWDWIGETSPMMSGQSEPEFVLDRLCESLGRYMRRVELGKELMANPDAAKWKYEGGDGYHCGDADLNNAWAHTIESKGRKHRSDTSSSHSRGLSKKTEHHTNPEKR